MRPANLTRASLLAIAALTLAGSPMIAVAATTPSAGNTPTTAGGADGGLSAPQVDAPGATTGTTVPTTPVTPPTTPATTPAVPATTPASGTAATPVPPAYLVPSPASAQVDLVAAANITDPVLPIPGLRVAALVAALLMLFIVSLATVLRWLGRPSPLAGLGQGPRSRARRAKRQGLVEDVRDWLRRSR
jgi:hypothetical protein